MIDPEIIQLGNKLKKVVDQQVKIAKEAIDKVPDGDLKTDLNDLLKRASSGKVTQQEAQREIAKIMKDAYTD